MITRRLFGGSILGLFSGLFAPKSVASFQEKVSSPKYIIDLTKDVPFNITEILIHEQLYLCTILAEQDGIRLRITGPDYDPKPIGQVFRFFGKEDIISFINNPGNRISILRKADPKMTLWWLPFF